MGFNMKLKKILKIIFIISLVIVLIDQTSKIIVNKFVKEDIEVISNVLKITKLKNEGIAFGLNKQNLGNIVITLIILFVIFNFLISQRDKLTINNIIFLSFIISGGISNIIDRIFKGGVFDFIKIGEFPVFNIADICIVLGWLLFVISFLKDTAIDIKAGNLTRKDKKK